MEDKSKRKFINFAQPIFVYVPKSPNRQNREHNLAKEVYQSDLPTIKIIGTLYANFYNTAKLRHSQKNLEYKRPFFFPGTDKQ